MVQALAQMGWQVRVQQPTGGDATNMGSTPKPWPIHPPVAVEEDAKDEEDVWASDEEENAPGDSAAGADAQNWQQALLRAGFVLHTAGAGDTVYLERPPAGLSHQRGGERQHGSRPQASATGKSRAQAPGATAQQAQPLQQGRVGQGATAKAKSSMTGKILSANSVQRQTPPLPPPDILAAAAAGLVPHKDEPPRLKTALQLLETPEQVRMRGISNQFSAAESHIHLSEPFPFLDGLHLL